MFIKFFRSITMHGLIFCNRCNNLIWHLFGTIGQAFHDILLCFVLNVLSCKKSLFFSVNIELFCPCTSWQDFLIASRRLFKRNCHSLKNKQKYQKKLSVFKKQNTTQGQKNLSLNVNLDVKKAASMLAIKNDSNWFIVFDWVRSEMQTNASFVIFQQNDSTLWGGSSQTAH